MASITIQGVLKHAEDFERMLSDYYAGIASHTAREGVRLLTDYMARHRIRLHEALSRLDPAEAAHLIATPLRFQPKAADCTCFEKIQLPEGAGAAEVLDAAVTLDDCLILLYRQVLVQDISPEIRDLFESLLRSEQRDQMELKKIKAMDYF
ncbi:MAG: hypothetical protein HZA50_14125 [Planctomycetes bacterium]|nr:hypothetical protein [Planctomycetota bacterium]